MIDELCREHTDLSPEDVNKVKQIAASLEVMTDLLGVDVFVDCLTRDPDVAVVVAHARPVNGKSLYSGPVVGQYAHRSNEPATLRTLDVGMPTKDMLARTQEDKDVQQNVSPIKNNCGEVIACLIAETDITEDIRAKRNLSLLSHTTSQLTEALVNTKQKEQGLHYHVTDGIIIFDDKGQVILANPVARVIYKKLGYMDELEGLHFSNVTLEDIEFADVLENRHMSASEIGLGSLVLNVKFLVITRKMANKASAVMLIRDDTDVKAKEKELILKSVAIKEIHHRVKNNLQTIASLLRLQSRRIDDRSAQKAFSESINRVLSIAATHEILAEKGVDDVELSMMLKRIIRNVTGHTVEANKKIEIDFQGDSIQTNSDIASTIALVVNELLQNCFKHAFVGKEGGTIEIEIHKGNRYSNISITDDGVGFDVDSDPGKASFGNKIVKQLVTDKLRGNLNIKSGPHGTKVLFDFFNECDLGE